MKSSLGKLKRFAFQKSDSKERREFQPPAKVDELVQAFEEMQDMRDCYDGLLSAAAATANSAYEFSESLRDLGSCLLEKSPLYNDEESGKVLSMLGQVQFELQKLVDSYRSNIFVTITNPSQSLMNELQTVEEMKRQCDEKRSVYEYMTKLQKEKGRSKGGKGEGFTVEELQAAYTEYEEEATLCVFRLKSLKQGQSRSLLTQAARHHMAQLNFFRKGLKSLELVDPRVKLVSEKHHIDYDLRGLDEGNDNDEGDGENGDMKDDGELSFNCRSQRAGHEMVSTSRNSMELDQEELSFPRPSTVADSEAKLDQFQGEYTMVDSGARASSHSAPIFLEKKFDPAEKLRQMRPSLSQKFHSYALPTPDDAKSSTTTSRNSISSSRSKAASGSASSHKITPFSPLDSKMLSRDFKDEHSSIPVLRSDSSSKERQGPEGPLFLPLPLADGRQHVQEKTSDSKKVKRQSSFSGPLSSRPRPSKPDAIPSPELSKLNSGSVTQVSLGSHASFSKLPGSSVPPSMSSELHELPRPPTGTFNKPIRPSIPAGHSAPLTLRNPEHPVTSKSPTGSTVASSLPVPPLTVSRSFSIPSSGQRSAASAGLSEKIEEAISPPLTPISVANASGIVTTAESRFQPGNR